jgi:uncharacterized membrane protein
VLAGAATGLRSTVALAALVSRRSPGLPPLLEAPLARPAAGAAVASELVIDKLPNTPSRLSPPGLAGRLVFAAAAGALLARGAGRPVLPSVLIASATALVAARVGHDARVALAERFPPAAVAVAEDLLAIGLASLASGG